MSHLSVRTLLSDVAKSLADNIQTDYGRQSEFNMIRNKSHPWIWILPLYSGRQFLNNNLTKTKTWDVSILFLDMDSADADQAQSATILDRMDVLLDKYIHALDDWSIRSDDVLGAMTIQNDRQTPLYKDNSDIQSGWLLQFQMIVSEDFQYCFPENVDLYAGNI